MKKLCGYCRSSPARYRGWCDLCRFSVEQVTRMRVSKIAPVLLHQAPAAVEVDARLNAWLAAQQERKQ